MNEPQVLAAPRPITRARILIMLGAIALAAILLLAQLWTANAWGTATPLMLLARGFDVALTLCIVLACVGVGARLLVLLRVELKNVWLTLGFAFGLGVGALSLVLLGIGVLRVLYAPLILGILFGCLVLFHQDWRTLLREMANAWQHRTPLTLIEKIFVGVLLALLLPILLAALTPPIDGDALNYHLYAPAAFLREGAVYPMLDNIGANYPIALDVMYLFGLAAGTDIVSHLLQFSFAGAMTLAIYGFCATRFNRTTALLACVIFWCSSIISLEASAPIIDLGWGAYEFFAILAFVLWREKRTAPLLMLLGVMLGLAASNKYLALAGWAVMLLGVAGASAWDAWHSSDTARVSRVLRAVIMNGVLVLVPALVVAAPWYLKNAIWLGNPVYPFFTGAYGLSGTLERDAGDLGTWVGLGLGRDLGALLFFPYNVYFRWQYFYYFNRGGPTYFFWLLPLYLLVPKRPTLNWFWLFVAVRFGIWFLYAQNMRYLIFVFPILAILTAYGVVSVVSRWNRPFVRVGVGAFVVFCLAWGIVTQWGFLVVLREQALPFLTGQVSRNTYLAANLPSYPAVRFMNEALPQDAHILAMGDIRLYYLQRTARADQVQGHWFQLARDRDADGIAQRLRELGYTHLWVSQDDLRDLESSWKVASPLKTELFQSLRAQHLHELYADEHGHIVYRLD